MVKVGDWVEVLELVTKGSTIWDFDPDDPPRTVAQWAHAKVIDVDGSTITVRTEDGEIEEHTFEDRILGWPTIRWRGSTV